MGNWILGAISLPPSHRDTDGIYGNQWVIGSFGCCIGYAVKLWVVLVGTKLEEAAVSALSPSPSGKMRVVISCLRRILATKLEEAAVAAQKAIFFNNSSGIIIRVECRNAPTQLKL